jgi:murein DD-endopeptidase MepM/ murein hydrolase activator NlpD
MPAALLVALLAAVAEPPPAALEIAPAVVRPGDAVLVRVRAPATEAPATGAVGDRPLRFWPRGAEQWALAAVPVETPPGPLPVRVEAPRLGERTARLEVVDPGFPSRALQVPPRFVTPPESVKARIARDREAFARAFDRPFAPPLFTARFAWPHPGAHRGRYGDQRTFNGKKESVHYGLDIAAPRGAPVRAANDGEVVLARDCYYSGKTVAVWHGAGLFTLYFHLDRAEVRRGAKVRRGDRLGVVGSTGRSTGPHLHWSAKVGDLYVDPESLMGIDFGSGTAPPRRAGPPAAPDAPETPGAVTPGDAAPPR